MELEGIPVQPNSDEPLEFLTTFSQRQHFELRLTLKFNEQWESLGQGRVKFGLKGGELRLILENAESPYQSRELVGSVALDIPLNPQEPKSNPTHNAKQVSGFTLASFLNSHTPQNQVAVNASQKSQKTVASVTICHITTKVTEENPVWIFEEERGEFALRGLLAQAKLATINVLAVPCRIEATFIVSRRDVCLTDAEGLWKSEISPNKRAVLNRLIIQHLLEPKLKHYLSRAELHYD